MLLLVVLALLAFQLSIGFWQLFPAPTVGDNGLRIQTTRGDIPGAQQQSYLEKAQLISRAYLFGKPQLEESPVAEIEDAPETRLNYKLRGIFFSEVERLSSAIVEIKINDSKYYQLGDELADNISLAAIEPAYILIKRFGKLERLNLEKSVAGGAGPLFSSRANDPNSLASTTLLRSYRKRYVSNPMALAKRF